MRWTSRPKEGTSAAIPLSGSPILNHRGPNTRYEATNTALDHHDVIHTLDHHDVIHTLDHHDIIHMGRKRSRSQDRSGNSGVSRRTVLGLILAGGAGLAGAQQTGAFSSVTGDRGFNVQTASDKNALVGVETKPVSVESGENAALFTITNQFSDDLMVESVTLAAPAPNGLTIEGLSGTNVPLSPSGQHDVVATVSCDATIENKHVTVNIRASTDSESIELTRRSGDIQCQPAGGQCLTDRYIDRENETIPCVDVTINGKKQSSISLEGVTVTGDVNIVINGGGNADIEIEITDSHIQGDLIIRINGKKKNTEVAVENTTVDGDRRVDGK